MSLPSAIGKSSEIMDDGKRPFTVTLQLQQDFATTITSTKDKRYGFPMPCDCTVIQALLAGFATAGAAATMRLKIGTSTSITTFVSGLKFGGTNGPNNTTFWDLFATTNGLVTGWCKSTTKRQFDRGKVLIALVTRTVAPTATRNFGVILHCVPR